MKYFQETTEWSDGSDANHIYLLDDSKGKMYAYVPKGTDQLVQFKNPIKIDIRGRKFQPVAARWHYVGADEPKLEPKEKHVVKGSNGNEYVVEKVDGIYTCSCPGYKYRGDCKHVKEFGSE